MIINTCQRNVIKVFLYKESLQMMTSRRLAKNIHLVPLNYLYNKHLKLDTGILLCKL